MKLLSLQMPRLKKNTGIVYLIVFFNRRRITSSAFEQRRLYKSRALAITKDDVLEIKTTKRATGIKVLASSIKGKGITRIEDDDIN